MGCRLHLHLRSGRHHTVRYSASAGPNGKSPAKEQEQSLQVNDLILLELVIQKHIKTQ